MITFESLLLKVEQNNGQEYIYFLKGSQKVEYHFRVDIEMDWNKNKLEWKVPKFKPSANYQEDFALR